MAQTGNRRSEIRKQKVEIDFNFPYFSFLYSNFRFPIF